MGWIPKGPVMWTFDIRINLNKWLNTQSSYWFHNAWCPYDIVVMQYLTEVQQIISLDLQNLTLMYSFANASHTWKKRNGTVKLQINDVVLNFISPYKPNQQAIFTGLHIVSTALYICWCWCHSCSCNILLNKVISMLGHVKWYSALKKLIPSTA